MAIVIVQKFVHHWKKVCSFAGSVDNAIWSKATLTPMLDCRFKMKLSRANLTVSSIWSIESALILNCTSPLNPLHCDRRVLASAVQGGGSTSRDERTACADRSGSITKTMLDSCNSVWPSRHSKYLTEDSSPSNETDKTIRCRWSHLQQAVVTHSAKQDELHRPHMLKTYLWPAWDSWSQPRRSCVDWCPLQPKYWPNIW